MSTTTFEPRWASAPAETIRRVLSQRNWNADDLSERLGIGPTETRRLLDGKRRIDAPVAELLASTLGGSSEFWCEREAQFSASSKALLEEEFARQFPLEEMLKRGWIDSSPSWREEARNVLAFFNVETPTEGASRLQGALCSARYRASPSFDSDAVVLTTWMRQAERLADLSGRRPWDSAVLQRQITNLRALSKIADPAAFIPRAQTALESAGVALVVLRPLEGMRVSGVSFWTEQGTPTVALTARHMSDDHFWFTMFHELGHLLLHPEGGTFVDEFESVLDDSNLELEANDFAVESLLPYGIGEIEALGPKSLTIRAVAHFASSHGVAPGIVVGQLQHAGVLRANQLNGLKRRYRWNGAALSLRL